MILETCNYCKFALVTLMLRSDACCMRTSMYVYLFYIYSDSSTTATLLSNNIFYYAFILEKSVTIKKICLSTNWDFKYKYQKNFVRKHLQFLQLLLLLGLKLGYLTRLYPHLTRTRVLEFYLSASSQYQLLNTLEWNWSICWFVLFRKRRVRNIIILSMVSWFNVKKKWKISTKIEKT